MTEMDNNHSPFWINESDTKNYELFTINFFFFWMHLSSVTSKLKNDVIWNLDFALVHHEMILF